MFEKQSEHEKQGQGPKGPEPHQPGQGQPGQPPKGPEPPHQPAGPKGPGASHGAEGAGSGEGSESDQEQGDEKAAKRGGPAGRPPSADPSKPKEDAKVCATREEADKQLLEKLKDKYTKVNELKGGTFTHEGVCLRCGWHSMELSEDAAKQMVEQHVASHWRDAAVGIQLQGAGLQGLQGVETSDLALKAQIEKDKAVEEAAKKASEPIEKEVEERLKKVEELNKELAAKAAQPSAA